MTTKRFVCYCIECKGECSISQSSYYYHRRTRPRFDTAQPAAGENDNARQDNLQSPPLSFATGSSLVVEDSGEDIYGNSWTNRQSASVPSGG